jgi:hypothetical protein
LFADGVLAQNAFGVLGKEVLEGHVSGFLLCSVILGNEARTHK